MKDFLELMVVIGGAIGIFILWAMAVLLVFSPLFAVLYLIYKLAELFAK
jgi:type IV secretory pathway VirB3-like protein